MRGLFAFLLLPLLLAAGPARDWSASVNRTGAGAYVLGNPAARVKLIEYASYTCSHCAAFSGESAGVLKGQMIRSGSTSLELRHLIRDQVDLAAAVVARCTGPARFFRTSETIFAQQPQWLPHAIDYQEANNARLATYPPLAQLRALADGAGLTQLGRAAGLTDAAINACFADQAEVNRIVAMTATAKDVDATPTFFINGKKIAAYNWAALAPALRAGGAR
jgi:protein-disulfide isomerase